MGSPDPRSFSRGKRGIAGTLIFTQFDRDALIDELRKDEKTSKFTTFKANQLVDPVTGQVYSQYASELTGFNYDLSGIASMDQWDAIMTKLGYKNGAQDFTSEAIIEYADQIPPFHVTITFANEYGQKAKIEIHYVELLNEQTGFSIDDVVAAKSYTFVARKVIPMKKL